MTALHAWGAVAAVVMLVLVAIAGTVSAVSGRGFRILDLLQRIAVGATGVTGLIGIVQLLTGRGPTETLHLLYGVALLAVLPAAGAFASDAPPGARAGVVAGAAGIGLILSWRLFATG